ncbi:hypothetical protein BGX29_002147 [Mortierella sp. GBA35]|nr:hypothetical protein BGX29_002147 [Mortierella sp. GBA35]
MSKVNPVTVECSLPAKLESKAMYSEHWKTLQTDQMLLGIFLPGTVKNAMITVINEPPPPKERIYETRVAALKMIPAEALATDACSMLRSPQESTNNVWGIHVAGIGSFATSAAKLLPVAAQTVTFVDQIKDMLNWIARVMLKTFQATTGVPLSISSVLDLKNEDFLDDEIVRSIMELFRELYGTNDRYLFISPIQIQLWKQDIFKEWEKSKVESGQVEKAFAVVHMPGHWGALEVDFVVDQESHDVAENKAAARIAEKEAVIETKIEEEKLAAEINTAHNTAKGKAGAGAKTAAAKGEEEKHTAEIEASRFSAEEKIVESKNVEVKDVWDKAVGDKAADDQKVIAKITVDVRSSGEANPGSEMDIDKSTDDSIPMPWAPEIGTVFESLQAFEDLLHPWGHRLGFELKRKQSRLDHDPRVIFGCSFSGTHKAIKNPNPDLHRNKVSKRTNCPFKITVRSPQSIAPAWHITSINPAHNNHAFQSGTQEFNRVDKQLNSDMHAMIASFDGRFNLEQVIYLLNKEWPDKMFDRRTVANAIQKTKIMASRYDGSEAAELYKILQDKAYEDKD